MQCILCEYCGIISPLCHPQSCQSPNLFDPERSIIYCYSCNIPNPEFSKSQLQNSKNPRCKSCISNNITLKATPFATQAFSFPNPNYQLFLHIQNIELSQILSLLQNNANPNYQRQDSIFDIISCKTRPLYNPDGSEKKENDPNQPSTPLKICTFILSNHLFSTQNKLDIIEIAKLLIQYGANKKEALQYFTQIYNLPPYDDQIFTKFFNLLNEN